MFAGAPQRVSSFHHKACYEIHTIVILVALIHRPSPRRVSHRSGNRSVEAKSSHSPPLPSRTFPPPPADFFLSRSISSPHRVSKGNTATMPLAHCGFVPAPKDRTGVRQARVTPFPETQDGPGQINVGVFFFRRMYCGTTTCAPMRYV